MLLFFGEYQVDHRRGTQAIRRLLRPVRSRLLRRPGVTGFEVWYRLLVRALERQDVDVRRNDYRFARANPSHPVGVLGYTSLLEQWSLPNPAVLGPGFYDHPVLAPDLMDDPHYCRYIVTCNWMFAQFAPVYGQDRCTLWNAGIDTSQWPDLSGHAKSVDVLIYDKIRWDRSILVPELLDQLTDLLRRRNLTFEIIRYGQYDYAMFRTMLAKSRAMVFLCEHETQGMAYQEAMASNLPVLAWDPGTWRDPLVAARQLGVVPTTSVPYFSSSCGLTFRTGDELPERLDEFWSELGTYTPRRFVEKELSLEASASRYLEIYAAAAR